MPKLIMTISETVAAIPDSPGEFISGIETEFHMEFAEGEDQSHTLLRRLIPFFKAAMEVAEQSVLGGPILRDGNDLITQEEAIAALKANPFPGELP